MIDSGIAQLFRPGPDCLPVDELSASLNLPEGSAQRRTVENHVVTCTRCHNELALLNAFESGAIRENEREAVEAITGRLGLAKRKAEKASASWWQRLVSPTGIAVALAVAAALIVAVNLDRGGLRPIATETADTFRSAPLRAISPLGEVDGIPREFRWTLVPGAATYSLNVMEVDHTPVFSDKVPGTSFSIPSEVGKLLQSGKTLAWNVIAYDNDGRRLASTTLQRIQVKSSK